MRAVEVAGNRAVSDAALLEGLANHPPSGLLLARSADYQPMQLTLDQRRIESNYKQRGYFSARVLDVRVLRAGEEDVAIVFLVEEGPPTFLRRVEIHGAPDDPTVSQQALARMVALEIDVPVRYEEYVRAKEQIRQALLSRGYAHATVEGRLLIDRPRGAATAIFRLDPGPVTTFGQVEVKGLEKTPQSVVLNRIAWERGERFDPLKLEETRLALYSAGLISNVHFSWSEDPSQEVLDIDVIAREGLRHELRLGAGVGIDRTRYEARARFGYTHRNFLDPKATLRLSLRPGIGFLPGGDLLGANVEAEGSIERIDLFFPLWTGKVAVDYGLNEFQAYNRQATGVRASMARLLADDRLILTFAVSYRFDDFLRIEPALEPITAAIGLEDPQSFATFEPTVTLDTRDDPLAPSRGFFGRLPLEIGRVLTGDDRTFVRLTPEVRGYWPMTSWLVGAVRARFGTRLLELGSLPVTERYFSGGAETQRGFGRNRLAPSVAAADSDGTVPYGGEALVEGNLELRIDLFDLWGQQLRAVVFFDAADAANALSEIELPLHYASGAGLRYDTPVGPVRADFGVRLNRVGPGEPDPGDRFTFHLSIGEAF